MSEADERAFQVDLHGVVDLLSRHLYSSPRVYVRELLQNAVDAITARRAIDPGAPCEIVLEPGPGDVLTVHDTGIGLTETEVHELLATIGRSGKRDELGFARHEFLGQFGIGLLSGFLVADEIHVETRSARGGPVVRWVGSADGRYHVTTLDRPRAPERERPGTTVTLRPRRDATRWLTESTVVELATLYGSLLPVPVRVGNRRINDVDAGPPWLARHPTPAERDRALTAYARETFGFTPLATVDLDVPAAGLTGVAFILPTPANPTARLTHRVYLKRMLLAENTAGIVPDWAFFARCVVDTAELRPTASREALYDDELLEDTREAIGARLREWLTRLAESDPARLRAFLELHHLGVKALALHDDTMLRIVDRWLEFETSDGPMPLARFRRGHEVVRYAPSVEEFRQLSGVAAAQGIGLVNGGYVYDAEIVERLSRLDPEARVPRLDPAELATHLGPLDPAAELALRPFLAAAAAALEPLGCDVAIRDFDPAALPALYLGSRAARHRVEFDEAREQAGDALWTGVLEALDRTVASDRPQLLLNYRNPLVRRITELPAPELARLAVEGMYGQALLHGRHPLRAADTAALNRSFLGLLEWAVHTPQDPAP
jgi:Histidine kinase-, DNA gyrase B-, and HSP90-like ATPase